MLKELRYVVLASLLFIVGGCSTVQTSTEQQREVYLTKTVAWFLPSSDVLDEPFRATQLVHARYGEKDFDLLFQLEKRDGQLVMAGLSLSGQQLLQLTYNRYKLETSVSPLVGNQLRLSYLLSDFMLSFGQENMLRNQLEKVGISLSSDGDTRLLSDHGQPIVSVSYSDEKKGPWAETLVYRNLALDYELTIKTLSWEPQ